MQTFEALNRRQQVHRHHLLEASAGTGKTFAIENVVVRLLIEVEPGALEPLAIEQILAVTFTRAATRELKGRIRTNIEKGITSLKNPTEGIPDYLLAIVEKGDDAVAKAVKYLEKALFNFDQAQIFTMHGFCSRMLRDHVFEGNLGLDATLDEVSQSETIRKVVGDYLRTGIHEGELTPEQLKIALKEVGNNPQGSSQFFGELSKASSRGIEIAETITLKTVFEQFCSGMNQIKQLGASPDTLYDDLMFLTSYFKKFGTQQLPNPEIKARRFAEMTSKRCWDSTDLDTLLRDGFLAGFEESNKNLVKTKKGIPVDKLHNPQLLTMIQQHLLPLLLNASDGTLIFAKLARDCQQMVRRYLHEEEIILSDDLLRKMALALNNHHFLEKVRNQYKAAIIDEFQDTDPVQWEIFRKLFLDNRKDGYLYIVGDPKQSIYAFRDADIYTYLSAAKALGEHHKASLATNYRSHEPLVNALNMLFSDRIAPGMISLPREGNYLPYTPVHAGTKTPIKQFSDELGAVHFFYGATEATGENLQQDYYFPFIAEEIQRLCKVDKVPYSQCAVLTHSHAQADDLDRFLTERGIPCEKQKSSSLGGSKAISAMQEILQGVLSPRNGSALRIALGGPIIGWTDVMVKGLSDHTELEKVMLKFHALRKKLTNQGFVRFYQDLMESCWHGDGKSVEECLLGREGGVAFYRDLQMVATILFEVQGSGSFSLEKLIAVLDEVKEASPEDQRFKRHPEPGREAVPIMTLHNSKGLEFDVVFALGLANRSMGHGPLIPSFQNGQRVMIPSNDQESSLLHQQEADAEKGRQLYVAMTRAKYRLYVPVAKYSRKTSKGLASPIELYLGRLGSSSICYEELYEKINHFDVATFFAFIHSLQKENGSITVSQCPKGGKSPKTIAEPTSLPVLIAPETVAIPGEPLELHSFTTLSKGKSAPETSSGTMPHNFTAEVKSPHTLPAGSETGNLLHEILETIPFHDPKGIKAVVNAVVEGTLFAAWEPVIRQLALDVVNKSLFDGSSTFCLKDVDPGEMYRETEFLYPLDPAIAYHELECTPGYLKGVIDLVFRHQGKYYILDWKSNWLGPDSAAYDSAGLDSAMRENSYYLQAAVYTGALKRYLKIGCPQKFDELFGGVFYLFLRGIEGEGGVSHFKPTLRL